MNDVEEIESCHVLGLVSRDSLGDIVEKLLEKDPTNENLLVLVGLLPIELDEAYSVFEKYLRSIGRGRMTKPDAAIIYAKCISRKILQNEIAPYEGAMKIWNASLKVGDVKFHDLDTFIYAASEYEDRLNDRAFFEEEIVKEAQRWATG